jgi:DMSO/TMAO reductase YedYZ molybdopterin-dependent catalytic subunit
MSGTISFTQGVITAPGDVYTVINYNVRTFKPEDYTLTITGDVTAEKVIKLAELQAREQVTWTATKTCVLNPNGGTMIANVEHTGVDLITLLTEIGLKEGANELVATAYDGWNWTQSIEVIKKAKTMLALKQHGEDIIPTRGGPILLAIKGEPGAEWVKYLKTIEIKTVPEDKLPAPTATMFSVPFTCYPVNAGFLKPTTDGTKVQSPVHIEGWAFSWPLKKVDKLMLSADYGKNWHEYDVPDYDNSQWISWTMEWTPPAPGKYLLKVKAKTGDEIQQREDNLVLDVTA